MSFISLSPCLFNSLLSQTFFFSIFLFFTWSLSQSISFCRSLCLLDYFFKSFSISFVLFLNLSLSLNSYKSLSGFPLFSGFFILSTHLSLSQIFTFSICFLSLFLTYFLHISLFLKFSLSPSVFSVTSSSYLSTFSFSLSQKQHIIKHVKRRKYELLSAGV